MKEFASAFKNMFMGGNGQGQNPWKCGGGNSEWKNNRALIVSVPTETFTGNPGETIMVEIIMKNNTHWPWKEGFSLQTLPQGNDDAGQQIERLVLPIDFFVDKMSTFNMLIPMKIKSGAVASDVEHVAKFTFINRKGTPFGQVIDIKYKVVEPINEVQFYQIAMTMFETQESFALPKYASFDQIVEVLKKTKGNQEKAIESLKKESKQEEQENQMEI